MKCFLWIVLLGWTLLSMGLHLSPIARPWGEWLEPIRKMYDSDSAAFQAFAHFILNAGFSFILLNLLNRQWHWFPAFLWTMCIAFAFAVSMEVLQSMLPYGYSRTCDLLDLLPASTGALFGGVSALGYFILRKTRGKRTTENHREGK